MDPLDSRIKIELVLEQERKWMDTLKMASVPAEGPDVHNTCGMVDWIWIYSTMKVNSYS